MTKAHGHGGQKQSGGMGGGKGGDLHDVGSGQSGMTGRGGMGGNETQKQGGKGSSQHAGPGERQSGDDASYDEFAEVQQSAPREGMGNHRHSSRGNEQAIDADAAVDDVGSHRGAAGRTSDEQAE